MSQQAGTPKKRSKMMILLLFLLIGISAATVYYFMGDPFASGEKPKTATKITQPIASKSIPATKKIGVSKSAEPVGGSVSNPTPPAKVESEKAVPVSKNVVAKVGTKPTGSVAKPEMLVNFEGDSAEAFGKKIADLENKIAENEKECASAEKEHKKTIDDLMAQIDKLKQSDQSKTSSPVSATAPKSGNAVSTRTKKSKRVKPQKVSADPVFTVGAKSYQGVPIESYSPRTASHQETPGVSDAPRTAFGDPAPSYAPRRKYEGDFTGTGSYFGGNTASRKSSGKTLYDMSVRYGDSFGMSAGGSESLYKLAPGVAVYPRKLGAY